MSPLFRNKSPLLQYCIHITMNTHFVAIRNIYCNARNLRQKASCYNKYVCCRNRSPFLATIPRTIATCRNRCNMGSNITTTFYFVATHALCCNKMVISCNAPQLSQQRHHIATWMQFVAVLGSYCNKRAAYHHEKKTWQYMEPITTNCNFVLISSLITTKDVRCNKYCCNRPDFLQCLQTSVRGARPENVAKSFLSTTSRFTCC